MLSFIFGACDETDGNKTPLRTSINSVDDLQEFISGLTYTYTDEAGNIVEFVPNNIYSDMPSTNFVWSSDGFDSKNNESISLQNEGSAILIVNGVEKKMNNVICTTVLDLKNRYPDIYFDNKFLDYYVFIAAVDKFSDEELINPSIGTITEYMQFLINPNATSDDGSRALGFYIESEDILYFYGNYQVDNTGLIAEGKAFDFFSGERLYYIARFYCD
ncbi:hypothetical protein E1176_11070 [Fulvivirga sp. RKSG066]|nr:hypothetical protein [Fulvivirga aurantia]